MQPVLTTSKKATKKPAVKKPTQPGDNSRQTLTQRQRIKNVEAIEHILNQHPLALYPHLEECIPPEVFEDVVSMLDPEMTMISDCPREVVPEQLPTDEPATFSMPGKQDEIPDVPGQPKIEEAKPVNPYRWLPEVEEIDAKDKKAQAEQQTNLLKSEEEEHIKTVTEQFCDWIASLGGDESTNIDESTITSLFSSGYETKPALSVPIHVVELASVPQELRMAAITVPAVHPLLAAQQLKQEFGKRLPCKPPTCKTYEYGAWYLEPKLWKKRLVGEPMRDPNDTKDKDISEGKQKSLDLDHELANMSGVKLFMDFVENKDIRQPEFVTHVKEILTQQHEEQEAEHTQPKSPSPKTTQSSKK